LVSAGRLSMHIASTKQLNAIVTLASSRFRHLDRVDTLSMQV